MGINKFVWILLIVVLLFAVTTLSWSHKPLYLGGISISPKYPLKLGEPLHFNIHADVGSKAEMASLDIKLSDGLRLVKGDLHIAEGEVWKEPLGEDIIVQIDHPGTYELNVICKIVRMKNDSSRVLTRSSSQFFYAREDTVIRFSSRSGMEKAIRDSLVYPGVATRRYYARRDSIVRSWHDSTKQQIKH